MILSVVILRRFLLRSDNVTKGTKGTSEVVLFVGTACLLFATSIAIIYNGPRARTI